MVLENVLLCSPERFLAIYEINVRLQSGKTFSLSKKLTNQPFGTPKQVRAFDNIAGRLQAGTVSIGV